MTDILPLLDDPTTSAALTIARRWCKGRRIGTTDALTHALAVAGTLRRYIPDAAPDVVAAALLHDSPDLAPAGIDLDAKLTALSPELARLVRALQHEHDGLDAGTIPAPPVSDVGLMQASTADKLVSIQDVLNRAGRAANPTAHWTRRRGFLAALPYLRAFHHAAEQVLPQPMAADLGVLVTLADQSAAAAQSTHPPATP